MSRNTEEDPLSRIGQIKRTRYLYEVGKEQDVGGGRPHVFPRGIPRLPHHHSPWVTCALLQPLLTIYRMDRSFLVCSTIYPVSTLFHESDRAQKTLFTPYIRPVIDPSFLDRAHFTSSIFITATSGPRAHTEYEPLLSIRRISRFSTSYQLQPFRITTTYSFRGHFFLFFSLFFYTFLFFSNTL